MPAMGPLRSLLFIIALVATARMALSISCPVSTCHPDDPNLPLIWLNTTSMGSKVHGLKFTTYPMTRTFPSVFTGASAEIVVYALQELQPHTVGKCDKDTIYPELSSEKGDILRELDLANVCCEIVAGWDMLEPTINRTTASVLVTDPLVPDFRFSVNFSLVNESVSYRQNGSANTGNQDYFETYSQYAAKITMDMHNWPWVAKNWANGTSNPSYLKFFLFGNGLLESGGNVTFWDAGITAHYYATTARSYLEMNFLKIFTIDGVDYATSLSPASGVRTLLDWTSFTAPFTIAACQVNQIISSPYYSHFRYDPSMSALFIDAEQTEALTPQAKSKRSLHPAAYIVPVVVVIVALVLAGIFILSPAARGAITGRPTKGISRPKDISDLGGHDVVAQPSAAGNPSTEPRMTAGSEASTAEDASPQRATFEKAQPSSRSSAQSSASWVRSSKIPQ